jgi:AIPR protein
MRETLSEASSRVLFPLLNNGTTVVARQVIPTANRFVVEDYQIVNGYQTSFVLHECRDLLNERVMVPVRLIATHDNGVKNAIIKATNRQTEVTDEQLFALTDFPKKLESYFPTFDVRRKLYYERRSRQYNGMPGIEKVRVINMTVLVRAFASVFLELPHRTTRNYKALLRQVGAEIFNQDHRLEPYYASAFAHYRVEYFFRNQTLKAELKPARYHLLMAYRLMIRPDGPPRMNSREMVRYANAIMENLWDDDRCRETFEGVAEHIMAVADGNMHRDNIRTEAFTQNLIARLQSV